MLRILASTLFLSAGLSLGTAAQDAGDWAQFRGPNGLAVADETPLPRAFGPDRNVLWKTKIPAGHSSPCVVGKRIFVTGFEDGKNVALAVDRTSGDVLWSKSFEGSQHGPYFHPDAVPALPTPVSDGEHVAVYFANYGILVFDLDGKVLWEKRLPHPGHVFGVGSSPLLFDGLLIVSRDGAPEAGLFAYDITDGTELWKVDRFEFAESHGTPFLWRNADRDELVVGGTHQLRSYDPGTGELLWTVPNLTNFPCTTPTADDDTLYYAAWSTPNATGRSFWDAGFGRSLELSDEEVADPAKLFLRLDANEDGKVELDEVPECRAKDAFGFLDRNRSGVWELEELTAADATAATQGRNVMVAVARGAEGELSDEKLRWTYKRGLPYVASPLLYRGRIWLFKAGGMVTCLDAETGEAIFDRERLGDRSEYYMSPVGAGGKVICGSAEGTLYVFDADADEPVIEQTVVFDEELFATPAVLDGTVYLRSKETLWAFGAPKQ